MVKKTDFADKKSDNPQKRQKIVDGNMGSMV